MTSSNDLGTSYSKRFIGLGIAIIGAVILYTIAWFFIANQLETRADTAIRDLKLSAKTATCDNLEAKGYPFRIGVFCDQTGYSAGEISVKAGALRSAAQIYAPTKVFSEIDSPAQIIASDGSTLTLTWDSLASVFVHDKPLPQRASLEAKALKIEGTLPDTNITLMIENAQTHMRQRGDEADIALSLRGAQSPLAPNLPQANIVGDLIVADKTMLTALQRIGPRALYGQSLELKTLSLAFVDSGALTMSGPLSFDNSGRANGEITIIASDLPAFAKALVQLAPDLKPSFDQFLPMAQSFIGEGDRPITLPINEGRVVFGFFKLFDIPAL